MTLSTRHSDTHRRTRNHEMEMDTTAVNRTVQATIDTEDEFQEINLDSSENESYTNKDTSIENDNFDVNSIDTLYPMKNLNGSIYPKADLYTQQNFSGIPRKRMRQWSENDLYLPEMRQYYKNRTFAEIHRPINDSSTIYVNQKCNTEIRPNVGLDEAMSSNMIRINKELESHSQQLQKISNDVQQLHKVNNDNRTFTWQVL